VASISAIAAFCSLSYLISSTLWHAKLQWHQCTFSLAVAMLLVTFPLTLLLALVVLTAKQTLSTVK
jgi:hypothetical protein